MVVKSGKFEFAKTILIIDNLKAGGAEQVFVDIVNLCNHKIAFDILFITDFKQNAYIIPDNIEVIRLNRKNKYSILSVFRVYKILKKYSLAHIHMRHTFRYLAIVKRIFNLKTKYLFHDHYGSIDIDQSLPFKGALYFKPDFYIGVCPKLRDWAIDVWKLPREKTIFLNNLPSLRYQNVLNFNNSDKLDAMILVGNIKPIKNQIFALNVAVKSEIPICIVGQNQDNEYFNQLMCQIQGNTILQNCTDVSTELVNYKLALCTSKSESGPLVLLEYLLCGIPFISYKTGGISEVLYKYFPEFFIDNFDETLWIERVKKFMNQPPKIELDKVREIIKLEFNRDDYFQKLSTIYESR